MMKHATRIVHVARLSHAASELKFCRFLSKASYADSRTLRGLGCPSRASPAPWLRRARRSRHYWTKKLAGGTCERRWRLWVWQRPWIATTRAQPSSRQEKPHDERYDSTGDVSAAMANTSSYNQRPVCSPAPFRGAREQSSASPLMRDEASSSSLPPACRPHSAAFGNR